MNNINKSIYYNRLFILVLLIVIFFASGSYGNPNQEPDQDFTNAENAEEKRAKWGTEQFKLELIKEMSSANIALFIEEHLKSINEPSGIYYKFKKESTREDNFVGNVVLNIVKIDDDNTKTYNF